LLQIGKYLLQQNCLQGIKKVIEAGSSSGEVSTAQTEKYENGVQSILLVVRDIF
jgi:hypothetical protein